ncbi:MAG: class I SAM-dependent methyltransferase [Myxococcota bacterium]
MEDSSIPDRYFLPEDYRSNPVPSRSDANGDHAYWTWSRRFSSRYCQYSVYRYAARILEGQRYSSVVDVGCGPGLKLAWLWKQHPSVSFVGIDQPEAIEFCKKNHPFGEWYVDDLDAPDLEFIGGSADLVICADVIEHLENPDLLLGRLAKRVKPEGRVLLTTPDRTARWGQSVRHSPIPDHVREWGSDELESYLHDRGFEVVEHFRDWPIRVGPNPYFVVDLARQLWAGNTPRYNQICLLRLPA